MTASPTVSFTVVIHDIDRLFDLRAGSGAERRLPGRDGLERNDWLAVVFWPLWLPVGLLLRARKMQRRRRWQAMRRAESSANAVRPPKRP